MCVFIPVQALIGFVCMSNPVHGERQWRELKQTSSLASSGWAWWHLLLFASCVVMISLLWRLFLLSHHSFHQFGASQSSLQGPGWGEVSHTGTAKHKHLSRYFEQGKWCRVTSSEVMVSVLLGRGAVLHWSSFKAYDSFKSRKQWDTEGFCLQTAWLVLSSCFFHLIPDLRDPWHFGRTLRCFQWY